MLSGVHCASFKMWTIPVNAVALPSKTADRFVPSAALLRCGSMSRPRLPLGGAASTCARTYFFRAMTECPKIIVIHFFMIVNPLRLKNGA